MKRICSILILIVLLLNSSVMVLISQAVDAVAEILSTEDNNIQSTQDISIDKYINYANNLEKGTMIQLKVKVGLQKGQSEQAIQELEETYINERTITIESPKISNKIPTRVEVIGKESNYANGVITIQEKYEQKLKYDGIKEYTLILFYDADCYTDLNEERTLDAKVSVMQVISDNKTSQTSEKDVTVQGEATTQITVTENIGTIVSVDYDTETIYNGYINSNIENGTAYDTEYQETAKIMISNKNIAESFIVTSNNTFGFQGEEISNNNNLLYKNLVIERSKIEDILGANGEIRILGQDNQILDFFNNEVEAGEDGKYVYTFAEPVQNIKLQITNIAKEGTIEFNTTKIIKSSIAQNVDLVKNILNISGVQTTTVKTIDEATQTEVDSEETNIIYVENLENDIAIQNASEKISMSVNKQQFSNNAQNDITLTATLERNNPANKLFENPTVVIEFPEEVEKVILKNTQILHDLELSKQNAIVETNAEGKQVIKVSLTGKQTQYINEDNIAKGTNILISATVILKQNISSKDSTIKMICDNATFEQPIKLIEKNQMVAKAPAKNAVEGNVVNSNGLKIDTKVIAGDKILSNNETIYEEQILKYQVEITNTTDSNIENVKVVGKIPDGMTYVDLVEGTFYNENYEFVPNTEVRQKEIEVGTLSAGQTETYYYEVKVNDLLDTETQKATNSEVKVYIGENEISTYTLANTISQADIAVELKNVEGRHRRNGIVYFAKVSNISNIDQKNVTVNIPLSENLQIEEIEIWGQEEGTYEKVVQNNNISVKFNNIKKFENSDNTNQDEDDVLGFELAENEVGIYITANVVNIEENDDYSWSINTIATATAEDGRVYKSNESRATGYIEAVRITQESNRTGEILNAGDEVIYTIKIENLGDVTPEWGKYTKVNLIDYIPNQLKVYSVTYNTNSISYNTEKYEKEVIVTPQDTYLDFTQIDEMNNNITDEPRLKLDLYIGMNETSIITIKTRVDAVPKNVKIENYATVTGEFIKTKQSNIIQNTIKGYLTDDSEIIEDPSDPNKPVNPDEPGPDNPDNPETKKHTISGLAWIDENENGQREETEQRLSGVEVMLLDITNNQYVQDGNGNIITKTTNTNGQYSFDNINEGNYYVIFKYNNEDYEITTYQQSGVSLDTNSDAMQREIMLNNEAVFVGLTDIINLTSDKQNIDLGLIKNKIFDLKVDKYIQKITVQNSKGTKQYNYNNEKFAKIEIPAKQIANSTLAVEYKIVVTNVGELAGTVNELIDEMPSSLEFNSELNSNWYRAIGNNLGNTSLSRQEIKPGESVETTIILTKKLDDTIQTYTNIAKIGISDNEKHISDMNTANDSDKVEIIVSIQTGSLTRYIGTVVASILSIAIILCITLIITKKFKFTKGTKILFIIAFMLAIIPSANLVNSYTEEEIWRDYRYISVSFSRINGQKHFTAKIAQSYQEIDGCISPGKAQCGKLHQYELDRVECDTTGKYEGGTAPDGLATDLHFMFGFMEEGYGQNVKEDTPTDKIHPTKYYTIGNKEMHGPFKLEPTEALVEGAYNDVVKNVYVRLNKVILTVNYKGKEYYIKTSVPEEDEHKAENIYGTGGVLINYNDDWHTYQEYEKDHTEEECHEFNKIRESLVNIIFSMDDAAGNKRENMKLRTDPGGPAGVPVEQEEFYISMDRSSDTNTDMDMTIKGFGCYFATGEMTSGYTVDKEWHLYYKCIGISGDDTHCGSASRVQDMLMILQESRNEIKPVEYGVNTEYLFNAQTQEKTITVEKVDYYDNTKKLENVEFIVKNDQLGYVKQNQGDNSIEYVGNETDATIFKTNAEGTFTVSGLRTEGTYSLIEKYNPHYGYDNIKNQNVKRVVDSDKSTITYIAKNTPLVGNIQINKENDKDSNIKLSNVEFVVLNNTGDKYLKVKVEGKEGFQSGSANKQIGTINVTGKEFTDKIEEATIFVTDANGQISINNLELEAVDISLDNTNTLNYIIRETYNPYYGYELDGNYISWEVNGQGMGVGIDKSINIPNQGTAKVTVKNEQKYVRISGYVWEDMPEGKDNVMDDLYKASADKLVQGVKVTLHNTKTGRSYVKWTDSKGAYLFGSKDANGKYSDDNILLRDIDNYYIEIEYNGMKYTNVVPHVDRENGSKMIEGTNRPTYNNKFATIEGDKAIADNKTQGNALDANGNKVGTINYNESVTYVAGTNDIANIEAKVTYTEGQEYADRNAGVRLNDYYAVDKYHISATTEQQAYKLKTTYKTNDEEIKNINLGIKVREQVDLAIGSDIEDVHVSLNGYTHTYNYATRNKYLKNKDGFNVGVKFGDKYLDRYTRTVYQSAVSYFAEDRNNNKVEVNVEYKIVTENQSTTLSSKANRITSYFDAEYTPQEVYYKEGDRKVVITNWSVGSQTYANGRFKELNVNLPDKYLAPGESFEIYVKYKVSDEAVLGLLNKEATLEHISEISSYSTYTKSGTSYAHYASIDEDSAPKNAIIALDGNNRVIRTTYEDDTDKAPSLVLQADKSNIISGTVFEDSQTQASKNTNERLGNGIYESNTENVVVGAKVELLEVYDDNDNVDASLKGTIKYENGNPKVATLYQIVQDENGQNKKVLVPAETYTDANGNYQFVGMIPDGYAVRYTYGEGTRIKNIKTLAYTNIDVKDYKSTIIASSEIRKALNIQPDTATIDGRGNYNWNTLQEKDANGNIIRYSDAVDEIQERMQEEAEDKILDYSTIENHAKNMKARTASFIVGVEFENINSATNVYLRDTNGDVVVDANGEPMPDPNFYSENKNIDFGIILRPVVELVLDKNLTNMSIQLSNGQMLVNGNPYLSNLPYTRAVEDNIYVDMDADIIQGAALNMEYEIKIINNSEVDYRYTTRDAIGTAGRRYYYFGDKTGAQKIDKYVHLVGDYLDEEVVYDLGEMNRGLEKGWEVTTAKQLYDAGKISEDTYNALTEDKQTVFTTQEFSEGTGTSNNPNIAISKTLRFKVSKLLGAKDELVFTNDAEILEIYASARKTGKNARPGNLIPQHPVEKDEDSVMLLIMPPTGGNDYTGYIITAIGSLLLIIAGVVLIKKKVSEGRR